MLLPATPASRAGKRKLISHESDRASNMSSIHWYLTPPIKRQHVQYAMLYSFENAPVLAISTTRKHIKHLRRHHTKRARRNCPLNCMRLFHTALLLLTSYISDWCETMIFTNKHQTQKHCQSNKSCIFLHLRPIKSTVVYNELPIIQSASSVLLSLLHVNTLLHH